MDNYIGQIILWSADWEIEGWMRCEGQILKIMEHQALHSIIGTKYGGDGRTTFALPDLRGRVPIGYGQGKGLSNRYLGEEGGQETTTLTIAQLPSHTHRVISTDAQNQATSANAVTIDALSVHNPEYPIGGNEAHNNMQPYLALTYLILVSGGSYPPKAY